jgi:hypothetical protein
MSAGTNAAQFKQTLINSTNAPITVQYSVTPTSGTCAGTAFKVNLTVNPTPSIADKTATICSGGTFNVEPTNGSDIVPAGTTYTWTVTLNANVTGESDETVPKNSISQTLTNSVNGVQTVEYEVTPKSGNCEGAKFKVIVTVNPPPVRTNKTGSICSGTAYSLPTVATGEYAPAGTTYSWSQPSAITGISGMSAGTSQSTFSQTLSNSTAAPINVSYTVTPSLNGCAGAQFTVDVTVKPKLAITGNKITRTICSGTTFTATPADGTDGVVPANTQYTWTVSPASGSVVSGQSAGSGSAISQPLTNHTATAQTVIYTVNATSDGCAGTQFTVEVTVNPKPAIANKTATICSGGTYSLTTGGTDIVPTGTQYSWAAPVVAGIGGMSGGTNLSAFSQTLTNSTANTLQAVYHITPRVTIDGQTCVGEEFTVTIDVNPTAGMTLSSSASIAPVCSGSTVSYTATSATSGATFSWVRLPAAGITPAPSGSVSSNAISETLTNTTNAPIEVTYRFTLSKGTCTNTADVKVIIKPTLSITNNKITRTICSGTAFTATPVNGTDGVVPAGTTYTWTVSPTSSSTGVSGQSAASNQTASRQTLFTHTATALVVN